jgi:KEOPS complex subunit Cgi121
MEIVGLKGNIRFEEMSERLRSCGAEIALMDASMVFGKIHVISAAEHAERSFRDGTNRSKTFITEFLMYMAGERQISKALDRMRPKSKDMVAVLFSGDITVLNGMGERDDALIDGTEAKAQCIGISRNGLDVSYDDLVLETVAMLDIMKI